MPVNKAGQTMIQNALPKEFEWGGGAGPVPGNNPFCPVGGPAGGPFGPNAAPQSAMTTAPGAIQGAPGAAKTAPLGQQAAPCPIPPGTTEWEAPEAPKKPKPPKTKAAKAAKAGAAKAGAVKAGAATPAPVANAQTVAMTGTKSAAGVGAIAKTGGTIWAGTGSSLGLGLGLGAWGPVLLVGVASAIGFGTYYYMKKRHQANAEELNEATS
ncbi:MAG: hypothetical protein HQL64_09895 [Magnetococcales bacterium]|nr:hypothetical protein [Magnetococcales bacterium]